MAALKGSFDISARNKSAWLSFSIALALNLLAVILLITNPPVPIEAGRGVRGYYVLMSLFVGFLGMLILSRFPFHGIGRVFMALSVVASGIGVIQESTYLAVFGQPGPASIGELMAWIWHWIWIPATPLLIFIPLLFPDGKLPSPRWKGWIWLAFANALLRMLTAAFATGPLSTIPSIDNPFGIQAAAALIDAAAGITGFVFMGVFLVASVSLIFRYRRAGKSERQQIKWFVFAVAVFALTSPSSNFPFPWYLISAGAFVFIPIAVVLAIFRYRLYDIDIIIRRSLVYTVLAGSLALVYYATVVFMQAVFRGITGQESQVAIVVSTLAIAALFNPLQRRIQDLIDRRFYRRKYNAEQTLDHFNRTVRDEVSMEKTAELLIETVEKTMQPGHISLLLRK